MARSGRNSKNEPCFIDKNYHVSPQIEPHQIAEIAEKGFVKIICNRPDVEVPEWYSSSVMEKVSRGGRN